MPDRVLVFYGSYRATRVGIRMASFVVNELRARGALPELIDARETGLPILDRMYKEYPKGSAPPAMESLAEKIRTADAFVFVVGEYNLGPQPGLKNLTDHFLEEWYWRPAAIVSYSPGRLAGVRARLGLAYHSVGDGHDRRLEYGGRGLHSGDARRARRADRRGGSCGEKGVRPPCR